VVRLSWEAEERLFAGCDEADCAKAAVWLRSKQPNAAKETARLMARSGVTLLVCFGWPMQFAPDMLSVLTQR
jgi:hypothetical protein